MNGDSAPRSQVRRRQSSHASMWGMAAKLRPVRRGASRRATSASDAPQFLGNARVPRRNRGPTVRPMLTQTATFAVYGLEPRQVCVEVDIRQGLPAFAIVGLGDKAVRESRERVRAALQNSGFQFPQQRIT